MGAWATQPQINAEYQKLVRRFGATMSLEDLTSLNLHDEWKKRPRTSKAMDDAFGRGTSPAERAIPCPRHFFWMASSLRHCTSALTTAAGSLA